MNAAIAPVNLFWAPSSSSIISSARFSASSEISAAGWWIRSTSSLMAPLWGSSWLLQIDAFLGEVLHRAGVPGHGRGAFLLVLELDVLGFLVRAYQLVLVIEHRLDDLVRGVGIHLLVRDQQIVDRGDVVVLVHAVIDVLGDHVLHVELAVLLVHRRHEVSVIDQLGLHAR